MIRNIEIIGEATKNISDSIRQKAPDIPWRSIARMRDKLIHHYFGVNIDVGWNVVQDDMSALIDTVESILQDPEETTHDNSV